MMMQSNMDDAIAAGCNNIHHHLKVVKTKTVNRPNITLCTCIVNIYSNATA